MEARLANRDSYDSGLWCSRIGEFPFANRIVKTEINTIINELIDQCDSCDYFLLDILYFRFYIIILKNCIYLELLLNKRESICIKMKVHGWKVEI